MAASILLGSMLYVSIWGSTKTGLAPIYDIARTVAIYVLEGTITSSLLSIFKAFNAKCKASSPLLTPTEYAVLLNFA